MKKLKTKASSILLVGIGNCGRKDDGLGWEFTERAHLMAGSCLDVEFRYQLQVEDVLLVCRYDKVYFADATHTNLQEGFECKPCTAAQHYFFSSHLQTPETILYLAKELYDKNPEACTIAIEGLDWGLGTDMSRTAKRNLQKAISFFKKELLPAAAAACEMI